MSAKPVVIGVGRWNHKSPRSYVGELATALASYGHEVTIVATEASPCVEVTSLPGRVSIETLPHGPRDDWSDRWLALIRRLEERAPCVYLSMQDWTAACMTPRLSNRVIVVGVLQDGSLDEQQHCFRVGEYWNAVVAVDPRMRQRVFVEHQVLAARLAPIHSEATDDASTVFSERQWSSLAGQYSQLFDELAENVKTGRFRRRPGKVPSPPMRAVIESGAQQVSRARKAVNAVPIWPDSAFSSSRAAATTENRDVPTIGARLQDHRIILTVPTGRISGVDVFAINLVTELTKRGYQAEVLRTSPPDRVADAMPMEASVPVSELALRDDATWGERWRALRIHLEQRAPCFYIPNYDTRHSAVVPTLSRDVKSIGIAHSDDPHHYAHIARLSNWWDGVVGVSQQVSRTLSSISPELASRVAAIPYGVHVPPRMPEKRRRQGDALRAVYAGRVMRYQKRILDLVAVGEIMQCRGVAAEITIVGNGPDAPALVNAFPRAALGRRVRWVGALANAQVLDVFAESDVFLLPSSFEGLPVSMLEAMAHGCVPVVYDVRSGVPEVVTDGVNGFIVPVGDVQGMADRIQLLEHDELLLRRMRAAAFQTVCDGGFDTSSMAERYLEFFDRVIASSRRKPRGNIVKPPELTALDVHLPRLPAGLHTKVSGLVKAVARFRGAP
jgi:Glycosyltransferase